MVQRTPPSILCRQFQLCVFFGESVFENLVEAMPCVAAVVHMIDDQSCGRVDGVRSQNVLITSFGVTPIARYHSEFRDAMGWLGS